VYVLVAILRRRLGCELPTADVLQVLSVNAFEKTPANTPFSQIGHTFPEECDRNQLRRFDF
jgi:hypothetical protein